MVPQSVEEIKKPHPFIYNPAEDHERFKEWTDEFKQPNLNNEMGNTVQS